SKLRVSALAFVQSRLIGCAIQTIPSCSTLWPWRTGGTSSRGWDSLKASETGPWEHGWSHYNRRDKQRHEDVEGTKGKTWNGAP
ncbi:MAG: hypothetical protein ABJQ14_13415, partial [Hyphomicrobiales bacterium]